METPFPPGCAAKYRAERVLGTGGFGSVFLATQIALDRPVVVKLLHAERLSDPDSLQRFHTEARLTAQLKHPHIVVLLDHGEEAGIPWIVYEFLSGQSLKDRLIASGALPLDEVVRIALQVCAALEEAHAHDALHRDIKPENICQDAEGNYKLMDFGIARWVGAALRTPTGMIFGTAAYLAPEIVRGEPVTGQADLYALGVTLFELLTGELPYWDDNPMLLLERHLRSPAPPPSARRADVPAELDRIVLRALAKQPADRYGTMAELRADLVRWQALQEPVERPRERRPKRRPPDGPPTRPESKHRKDAPPRPESRPRAQPAAGDSGVSVRRLRRMRMPVAGLVVVFGVVSVVAGALGWRARLRAAPRAPIRQAPQADPAGAVPAPLPLLDKDVQRWWQKVRSLRRMWVAALARRPAALAAFRPPFDPAVSHRIRGEVHGIVSEQQRSVPAVDDLLYQLDRELTRRGRGRLEDREAAEIALLLSMHVARVGTRTVFLRFAALRSLLDAQLHPERPRLRDHPEMAVDELASQSLDDNVGRSAEWFARAGPLLFRDDARVDTQLAALSGDVVLDFFRLNAILVESRLRGSLAQAVANETAQLERELKRPAPRGGLLRATCAAAWRAATYPRSRRFGELREAAQRYRDAVPGARPNIDAALAELEAEQGAAPSQAP